MLIQDVVICDPSKVQALARKAGKSCSLLIREVDPYDRGAKLGVDTLLALMAASKDVRPLYYMARQMGLELRKLPED
ncbi:MAG: amino acid-binding protein [Mailhella sp.]|nr:amino acid-binding protein [Mailhella sp.]